MRIGADGSWARWQRGGLGRYSEGLLRAMAAQLAPGDDLVVYYNATPGPPLLSGPRVAERFIRTHGRTAWNQVRLPLAVRRDRCDVYLATAFVAPYWCPVPSVVVVHDLMAFRLPEAKPGREGRYWRRWTATAVERAGSVAADSEFTARECAEILGRGDTQVVYPGVDAHFRPPADRELAGAVARRLGVRGEYVLQVGAYDLHKGADLARDAIGAVRASGRETTLVRCGQPTFRTEGGPGVIDAGYISEQELLSLYQAASAVAVTSNHEGFGLPLVEAMACGTPVASSRAGALPEIGGDVPEYFATGDARSLAAALTTILDEPPASRDRRTRLGRERAGRYSWQRAATAMIEQLKIVARPT